jgi:NAD(P)-dependent dehydrogenase (short-subunit alcohol dehydrogenase family)
MAYYLVTGSTSGVGEAVAEGLLKQSHFVVGLSRRPPETTPRSPMTAWRKVDFSFPPSTLVEEDLAALVEEFGPFSGVFHGAGSLEVRPLRLTSDYHWREAMSYASGTFALLKACSKKGFLVDGARVVVVSSVAAHRGVPGLGPYSAARAASESLVRTAAAELAPRNITVNAIAAGGFRSALHDKLTRAQGTSGAEAYGNRHLLGFGAPEDVSGLAVHLLTANSWATGAVFTVDGGYSTV